MINLPVLVSVLLVRPPHLIFSHFPFFHYMSFHAHLPGGGNSPLFFQAMNLHAPFFFFLWFPLFFLLVSLLCLCLFGEQSGKKVLCFSYCCLFLRFLRLNVDGTFSLFISSPFAPGVPSFTSRAPTGKIFPHSFCSFY